MNKHDLRLAALLARDGKEPSHALPQRRYGNPERHVRFEQERSAMPKLRRQEVEVADTEKTPYGKLMDLWSRWNALSDHQVSMGDGNPQDTKDFMRAGEALEAMINELPRHLWWAIRKSRGISTVWLFPHLSIEDALAKAEETLTPKMKNHIATRRYFD